VIAHVMGLPIEESLLQLAPAGLAMTVVVIAGRSSFGRLRGRILHRSPGISPRTADEASPASRRRAG
jgi:hypothetical protein